jgi:hypothetical protein
MSNDPHANEAEREARKLVEERLRSHLAEERLRIYLIDRLSSALLHNMRNTLQAVMGHAALLRIPIGEGLAASELSLKLQTAAEHCSENLDALNAVLCLPRHRFLSSRIHAVIRSIEPLLHDAVKSHHFLRIQIDQTLDRVRVAVQPLSQLLLLLCILSTETGEKGRTLQIDLTATNGADPKPPEVARQHPTINIRFCDARSSFTDVERLHIETPADPPAREQGAYPYWLLGALLIRTQALVELVTTTSGVALQVQWPLGTPAPLK